MCIASPASTPSSPATAKSAGLNRRRPVRASVSAPTTAPRAVSGTTRVDRGASPSGNARCPASSAGSASVATTRRGRPVASTSATAAAYGPAASRSAGSDRRNAPARAGWRRPPPRGAAGRRRPARRSRTSRPGWVRRDPPGCAQSRNSPAKRPARARHAPAGARRGPRPVLRGPALAALVDGWRRGGGRHGRPETVDGEPVHGADRRRRGSVNDAPWAAFAGAGRWRVFRGAFPPVTGRVRPSRSVGVHCRGAGTPVSGVGKSMTSSAWRCILHPWTTGGLRSPRPHLRAPFTPSRTRTSSRPCGGVAVPVREGGVR